MKTYHMYHTESISAESKLKDAEKQEEKQFSKSGDLNVNLLRHEDRPQRRSSVRKIEKMKEKVRLTPRLDDHNNIYNSCWLGLLPVLYVFSLVTSISGILCQRDPLSSM